MSRPPRPLLVGVLAVSCWCGIFCSCSRPDSSASEPRPVQALPRTDINVGGHAVTIENAVTPEQQARGLMFRKNMPENHGMLFHFPEPKRASFWMKNTLIPLSIAYVDQDGNILEIYPMEPLDTTPVSSRSYRVKYALEMNRGWFEQNGVKSGDQIENIPDFKD